MKPADPSAPVSMWDPESSRPGLAVAAYIAAILAAMLASHLAAGGFQW